MPSGAALDTTGLHIYSPTARREYGRVYYAVVDAETETGLLFVIGRRPSPDMVYPPQAFSENEIKDLFTLAQKRLGLWKFRMLGPVQLWEDEIQALLINKPVVDK